MRKLFWGLSVFVSLAMFMFASSQAKAAGIWDVWVTPYSWDPGLYAVVGNIGADTHAWGMRETGGAWGTGSVNYQTGSTSIVRQASTGILNVGVAATYCPSSCSYGAGSGYKTFVQFWNDPQNYIAIGFIHDPGVSPTGTTLMVEGAAYGKPIGGYWAPNAVPGTYHTLYFTWSPGSLSVTIDSNQATNLTYGIAMTNPSVSLLGAARNTGDIVDVTYTEKGYTSAMFAQYPYSLGW